MRGWTLTPDRRLSNAEVQTLVATLHDVWRPWIQRRGQEPGRVVWEWLLRPHDAVARLWVPAEDAPWIEEAIARAWPRVTLTACTDAPPPITEDTAIGTLTLAEHYAFALGGPPHSTAPLDGLLELTRWLREGETAALQTILVPASPDWGEGVRTALERWKDGTKPQRMALSGGDVAKSVALAGATVAVHLQALIAEIITSDPVTPEPVRSAWSAMPLSRMTLRKGRFPAFDMTWRLVVSSVDPQRRRQLLTMLAGAYRDLDGDNRLQLHPVSAQQRERWVSQWRERRAPWLKVNPDYLSVPEVTRLFYLPTGTLQEDFKLGTGPMREEAMPEHALRSGISLGTQTFRGRARPVAIPVDDWDELCLPRVAIGAMGSGKTKGFGANFGIEALRQGFSVITLDPAKDELGDEMATAAARIGLPADHIIRLRFGRDAYRLDWCEAMHGPRAANRLAGEALNFFNLHGYDAGVETTRYIRLAGKTVGALGASLKTMLDLFLDAEVRAEAVRQLGPLRPDLAQQWAAYEALSAGMRGKVTEPVLNRLDVLLGDDVLAECLTADQGVDFGAWLTGGYLVAIHLPDDLGREAKDILADFLLSNSPFAPLREDPLARRDLRKSA